MRGARARKLPSQSNTKIRGCCCSVFCLSLLFFWNLLELVRLWENLECVKSLCVKEISQSIFILVCACTSRGGRVSKPLFQLDGFQRFEASKFETSNWFFLLTFNKHVCSKLEVGAALQQLRAKFEFGRSESMFTYTCMYTYNTHVYIHIHICICINSQLKQRQRKRTYPGASEWELIPISMSHGDDTQIDESWRTCD